MPNSKSILIIDEDPNSQQMYLAALTGMSVSFHSCSNGNDGFEELTSETFDAVILKIPIVGVETDDFFQRLNKERIKYPPIIAIASQPSTKLQDVVMKNGADYFLVKPFNMSFLKYVVKEAFVIQDMTNESLKSIVNDCLARNRAASIWVKTEEGQGILTIENQHVSRVTFNGYTSDKALKILNQQNPIKIERVWKK